jgi:hypothetical protein
VSGLNQNLFTWGHFQRGRYIGMPAVVVLGRLISTSFGVIQLDAFHFVLLETNSWTSSGIIAY